MSALFDNDPYYVTADIAVDNNGNLVTDNSDETAITYVPTPDPTKLGSWPLRRCCCCC